MKQARRISALMLSLIMAAMLLPLSALSVGDGAPADPAAAAEPAANGFDSAGNPAGTVLDYDAQKNELDGNKSSIASRHELDEKLLPGYTEPKEFDPALGEALNIEGGTLEFTNDADYPWAPQELDGRLVAASTNQGVGYSAPSITLHFDELRSTHVLSFDWMLSAEWWGDTLDFYVNGELVEEFKGGLTPWEDYIPDTCWRGYSYEVPRIGEYTFTWVYSKDSSRNEQMDTAWLDNVSVGPATPAEGVSVVPQEITLPIGETERVSYLIDPANATNRNITWTSSDESVATVNTYGYVTAVAEGTAEITATTEDGGFSASCLVAVPAPVSVEGITMEPVSGIIPVASYSGEYYATPNAVVQPENATNRNITWTSGDEGIATVDSSGRVMGIAPGVVTITATTEDGGYTAECEITVAARDSLPGIETLEFTDMEVNSQVNERIGWNDGQLISYQWYMNGREDYIPRPVDAYRVDVERGQYLSFACVGSMYATIFDENFNVVRKPGTNSPLAFTPSEFGERLPIYESGTYYIVLTSSWITGDKDYTFSITEEPFNPPTSVRFWRDEVSFFTGQSITVGYFMNPNYYTPGGGTAFGLLDWTSSDESVAIVEDLGYNGGRVTAVGPGTATITGTAINGVSATCEITVNEPEMGEYVYVPVDYIVPGEEYLITDVYDGLTMMMGSEHFYADGGETDGLQADIAYLTEYEGRECIVAGAEAGDEWVFSGNAGASLMNVSTGQYLGAEIISDGLFMYYTLVMTQQPEWFFNWFDNGRLLIDGTGVVINYDYTIYGSYEQDMENMRHGFMLLGSAAEYLTPIKLYKKVAVGEELPPESTEADIGEALNIEGGSLEFTTGGDYPFVPYVQGDRLAMRSTNNDVHGDYDAGELSESAVSTTVEMKAGETLVFSWTISSEMYDHGWFYVNGEAVQLTEENKDWTRYYHTVQEDGAYTFEWKYRKDYTDHEGCDVLALDDVYVADDIEPLNPEAELYAYRIADFPQWNSGGQVGADHTWYSLNASDPETINALATYTDLDVAAAEYVNGVVYAYDALGHFYTVDMDTWQMNIVGPGVSNQYMQVYDLAYDFVTGKLYAQVYNGGFYFSENGIYIAEVDLTDGSLTEKAFFDDLYTLFPISGLACLGNGEFATVNGRDNSFVKFGFDLEPEVIAYIPLVDLFSEGSDQLRFFYPMNVLMSMTYNPEDGCLYWAGVADMSMGLYVNRLFAVEVESGRVSDMGFMGEQAGSEMVGMFVMSDYTPAPEYSISAGNVEANAGERAFVPVSMENLASGTFTIEYDADALTFIGYENSVEDAYIVVNDTVAGSLNIAVVNPNANYMGECMTLEFAVAEEAEGEYALDLTVGDGAAIVNEVTISVPAEEIEAAGGSIAVASGYTVTFNYMVDGEWVSESQPVVAGGAAIAPEALSQAHEITQYLFLGWDADFSAVYSDMEITAQYGLLGDVDLDESLTITDAMLIMRNIINLETFGGVQPLLADVDRSGDVSVADALYLIRLITGLEQFNG